MKTGKAGGFRPGRHLDFAKFKNTVKDAREDGKVTKSEREDIKEAYSKLEPGEKQAANKARENRDGHNDARLFKGIVKRAMADGKIDGKERAAIKKAFSKLEPGEQKKAIDKLAQSGHQRLAINLAQSENC